MGDLKEMSDRRKLLKKFLTGRGKTGDASTIRKWMDEPRAKHELFEGSFEYWNGIDPDQEIKGLDGDAILDRIHHNINTETVIFHSKTASDNRIAFFFLKAAAVLFLPLLLASVWLYQNNRSLKSSVSTAEIVAPYGTRTNFLLPDGSSGWLNGGSSLKYPLRFSGDTREVELTGEAYFKVASDKKNPFIVSTHDIDIVATGTSFDVMAFGDESITEVTLEKGRVEVFRNTGDRKSVGVLAPGQEFVYDSVSDSAATKQVNSEEKLAWIDGRLIFKYEPFRNVVSKLNRWYNVNIVIKDKALESDLYYGTFQDETLEEVLKLLRYTAPIAYRDLERKRNQDGTFEKRKIEIYYRR